MRTAFLSALAGACLLQAAGASAADLDYGILRGSDDYRAPAPVIDWSGVYAGGHGGWSSTAHGFSSVFQPLVADEMYRTTVEQEFQVSGLLRARSVRTTGGTFGGFAGYNFVADDFVFGIEMDYTRINQAGTSTDAIARQMTTSDGLLNVIDLAGTSRAKLVDYGTLRGRVGYILGSALPFVTAGVAFGHANIVDSVSVISYGYDKAAQNTVLGGTAAVVNNYGYATYNAATGQGTPAPASVRSKTAQKYAAGFTGGFGLDYALTSNIFLRGEYQYVLFDDFGGHKANVNTVRAAAAVKF